MSHRHTDVLESIKSQHALVVGLLSSAPGKGARSSTRRQRRLHADPAFDPATIQAAIANADDAYAMLLIVTAERFLREYLTLRGIRIDVQSRLGDLIDRTVKEFNASGPRVKIQRETVRELHDLREKRNLYAHGRGSAAFPSVGRIYTILGRFFARIP